MAGNHRGQVIPTQLDVRQFEEFVLPHLSSGRRGPKSKLSLHAPYFDTKKPVLAVRVHVINAQTVVNIQHIISALRFYCLNWENLTVTIQIMGFFSPSSIFVN